MMVNDQDEAIRTLSNIYDVSDETLADSEAMMGMLRAAFAKGVRTTYPGRRRRWTEKVQDWRDRLALRIAGRHYWGDE